MSYKKISKDDHSGIIKMYQSGMTYQEIADNYGVTRQYIQIIASNLGITRTDGGKNKKSNQKKAAANLERDKEYISQYGCGYDEYKHICRLSINHPAQAFTTQKFNALSRGIEWKFKFSDWWNLWEESGHWENRGRERGQYVMARLGDTGAYEVDNVEIITCTQNIRDVRYRESAARAKKGGDHLEQIRMAMNDRNLAEMGRIMKITRSYLQLVRAGKTVPTDEMTKRLSDYLTK